MRCSTIAVFTALLCLLLGRGSAALGQVYSNPFPITIPDVGNGTPFPSTITVNGGPVSMGQVTVTLLGFTHTFTGDVTVQLFSPSGRSIQLLSRNGNLTSPGAVGLTLSFSSAAVTPLPSPLVSGTFVPAGGVGSFSPLVSENSNGSWQLLVSDLAAMDSGSFSGGWAISFGEPTTPISTTAFTYQGKLTGGDANGSIDARFTVWDNPTTADPFYRLSAPVTVTGIRLVAGLFTANVDPGITLPINRQIFLQVEVANPAGSAFVSLSPRQPLTATPLARRAISATTATSADTAASAPWAGLTGQAEVRTGFSGIGTNWQMYFTNAAFGAGSSGFRGGLRLSDTGFFEASNTAQPTGGGILARLGNTGIWTASSDARLKTGVTLATGSLAAAMKLRPVNFTWLATGEADTGLIAQEVREVLPRLVVGAEDKEMLTVNYSQLSVVAIGAIQELKAKHDAELSVLRAQLAEQQRENDEIKDRLARIEAGMTKGQRPE